MVALKVRKVGNSLGLVLPKEVVNRLRTSEGEAACRRTPFLTESMTRSGNREGSLSRTDRPPEIGRGE